MTCCPIRFANFRTQSSITLPAGLKSVTVRNKGAGVVYVAGKELCPPATAPSSPCGNCAGESLTMDAGCGVYGQSINVNISDGGCAEITIEWSPNPLLDMTDSDGDGGELVKSQVVAVVVKPLTAAERRARMAVVAVGLD